MYGKIVNVVMNYFNIIVTMYIYLIKNVANLFTFYVIAIFNIVNNIL